jgi:hypothetical protein
VSLGGGGAVACAHRSLLSGRYALLVGWIGAGWDVERIASEARVHRSTVFRWLRSFGLSTRH